MSWFQTFLLHKINTFEKTYYKSEQTHSLQKDRQVINVQKLHNLNIWDPLDFLLWTLSKKTVKLAVLVIQLNWSVLVTKIVFKLTPNNWNLTPTKFSTQVNSRNSDFIWIFELSITKIWFHVKSEQHKEILNFGTEQNQNCMNFKVGVGFWDCELICGGKIGSPHLMSTTYF